MRINRKLILYTILFLILVVCGAMLSACQIDPNENYDNDKEEVVVDKEDLPTGNNEIDEPVCVFEYNLRTVVELRAFNESTKIANGTAVALYEEECFAFFVTNAHNLNQWDAVLGHQNFEFIQIRFFGEEKYIDATIYKIDYYTDLALIRINSVGIDITPAIIREDELRQEKVMAIGNANGQGLIVVEGNALSKVNLRFEGETNVSTVIESQLDIQPGHSGGALVDRHGRIVAVTTFRLRGDVNSEAGMSYSIPMYIVKDFIENIPLYEKIDLEISHFIRENGSDLVSSQTALPLELLIPRIKIKTESNNMVTNGKYSVHIFNGNIINAVVDGVGIRINDLKSFRNDEPFVDVQVRITLPGRTTRSDLFRVYIYLPLETFNIEVSEVDRGYNINLNPTFNYGFVSNNSLQAVHMETQQSLIVNNGILEIPYNIPSGKIRISASSREYDVSTVKFITIKPLSSDKMHFDYSHTINSYNVMLKAGDDTRIGVYYSGRPISYFGADFTITINKPNNYTLVTGGVIKFLDNAPDNISVEFVLNVKDGSSQIAIKFALTTFRVVGETSSVILENNLLNNVEESAIKISRWTDTSVTNININIIRLQWLSGIPGRINYEPTAGHKFMVLDPESQHSFVILRPVILQTYNEFIIETGLQEVYLHRRYVYTFEHLWELEKAQSNTTWFLVRDISLKGVPWKPIPQFRAILHGNGYSINDLTLNISTAAFTSDQYVGLFSVITSSGRVNNVTLGNVSIHGGTQHSGNRTTVGALTGRLDAGGIINGVIINGGKIELHRQNSRVGSWAGHALGIVENSIARNVIMIGNGDIAAGVGRLVGTVRHCRVENSIIEIYIAYNNRSAAGICALQRENSILEHSAVHNVTVRFIGYGGIDEREVQPNLGLVVGHLADSSILRHVAQTGLNTLDKGTLKTVTWWIFWPFSQGSHNQAKNVGAGPWGSFGKRDSGTKVI